MPNIATVNMGYRQRFGQMSKLLYMSDGYHQPKMYDGASLVNWGITPPAAAPVVAASSTGANALDMCEALWTPVSTVILDCETAWTLGNNVPNSLCSVSSDGISGLSALLLLGYAAEPITSKTVLMLHLDGTDGDSTTTDSAQYAHVITMGAKCRLSNVTPKWGTTCCRFTPTGTDDGRLSVPDHACFRTGTADLTVEMQLRQTTAYANTYICMMNDNGGGAVGGLWLRMASDTSIAISHRGSDIITRTIPSAGATWHHLRVCRASNWLYLFWDGTLLGAPEACTDAFTGNWGFRMAGSGSGFRAFDADEVRMDTGVALSTSSFVPPPAPYGNYVVPTNDPIGVTGLVEYKDLTSPVDYSGYIGMTFWIKSIKALQAGDLALGIADVGGGGSEIERITLPALQAEQWNKITYKFLNPAAMTSVASLALYSNRDVGQNSILIDDIRALRCFVSLETGDGLFTQGASSIRLDIPGNVPSNTLLAYKDLPSTDMTGDTLVAMSLRCDKTIGYQQFQYCLDDTLACASPLESINTPDNLAADTWHNINFTLVAPAALGAVISHGIKLKNNNIGPCSLWIDDVKRAVSTAGNLTGRYFAWVSFYNSKYDKESDLSPISSVIDCTGQSINLSSIPVSSDSQVDMRRIYRSAAGGTVPYLDSTINDNTTATLVLNKSDASILAAVRHPSLMAGAGKFQPPPAAPYIVLNKNRFSMAGALQYSRGTLTATTSSATFTFTSAQLDDSFIGRFIQVIGDTTQYVIISVNAGAKTCVARPIDDLVAGTYRGVTGAGKTYYITNGSENTVYTSYVDDDDTARPHGFPMEFAQDITEGVASDIISGLGKVGDAILVTKFMSTHLLEGAYPPYALSMLSNVLGCVSHDTIAQDENGMAFWLAGEQGIAMCNGSSVSLVSQKIEKIFTAGHVLSLNVSRFPYAHAVYDTKAKLYYLFCSSSASSINDVCIVLDKASADQNEWKWYYFTIEASASTIVYSTTGVGSIYITDYDGFQYQLNVGWYDGVSAGTLSGVATSVVGSVLNDTLAAFYTTGSGLRNIPLLVYKISTGETWVYKIASNTGTSLTITGAFTESPSTSDYRYYIGGYQIDWKSKQFELMRPTDKKLLMDGVLNNYKLTTSQKVRIQLLKNLAGTQIANQLRDLSEGEEQVMLVRERVSQAQWQISGFIHGQNVQIVSLGLRLKGRGIR